MFKTHVKRSTFQLVKITDANTATVLIEGDEAYATVFDATSTVAFKRQRERDLEAFIAANPATYTYNTQTFGTSDATQGRFPLDIPITVGGWLYNEPKTTTANDLAQAPERIRSQNVGFKEKIMIFLSNQAAGNRGSVLIETVHYVPVDLINA